MIQIAIVGCAHIHTPGFVKRIKERQDVQVKAVWDPNPARSAKRAQELGVAPTDNLKTVWRDRSIQAVIICSETNAHAAFVKSAAKRKRHMFVEKPLGMGSKDGYKMAAAIERAGVMFQTGYFMRGSPINLFLKQQVEAGAFGRITRIRGSNCHSGSLGGWFDAKPDNPADDWRWMADPAIAGVGAFGDLGTHSLDIMLWLMGDVKAATGCTNTGTARYSDCDETGEGILQFANGAIGTLAAAWLDIDNPVSLLISGTEAHAAVIHGKLHYHVKAKADPLRTRIKEMEAAGGDAEQIKQLKAQLDVVSGRAPWTDLPPAAPAGLDAFLNAIAGAPDGKLVTAREAAYRSAVMEAIYEGARRRKWVAPKPMP